MPACNSFGHEYPAPAPEFDIPPTDITVDGARADELGHADRKVGTRNEPMAQKD